MRKLISFTLIALFAIVLMFASPPDLRAAVKAERSVVNHINIFADVAITTATAKPTSAQSEYVVQRNKFILPSNDYRGIYRRAFNPPAKIYPPKDEFAIFDLPESVMNTRRKPEIVRMM